MNSILVGTVICPRCHAELDAHRDTCPHCRTSLHVSNTSSTISGSEEEQRRVLDRPWVIAILLLHVGFLGIPVYWKTRYSVGTRVMICLLSVAYTVFAVWFIVTVGSSVYRQFAGG